MAHTTHDVEFKCRATSRPPRPCSVWHSSPQANAGFRATSYSSNLPGNFTMLIHHLPCIILYTTTGTYSLARNAAGVHCSYLRCIVVGILEFIGPYNVNRNSDSSYHSAISCEQTNSYEHACKRATSQV